MSLTDEQLEAAAVAAENWPTSLDCTTTWWWATYNPEIGIVCVFG